MKSRIEWTEATWNPVTGCTRVSPGCDHCYAVVMSRRLGAMGNSKYKGLVNNGKKHFNGTVRCHPDTLSLPAKTRKPTMFFVNSMSDLFHPAVPEEFIASVFDAMKASPKHTFQVLTKRPSRMLQIVPTLAGESGKSFTHSPLRNVWLGTSVETQDYAEQRIPLLQQTPAHVRFLSCEPLLGPLDLEQFLGCGLIDWVIVGGESGPGARPMKREWVAQIRGQCSRSGIAFFFKQWGGVRKKEAGRRIDGRTYDEMPDKMPLVV